MALTERQVIGVITILEDGQLQIRTDTVIERDGVEIQRLHHRKVLAPGDDTRAEIDDRIRTVATAMWTAEVVQAYQNKQADLKRKLPSGTASGVITEGGGV